MIKKLLIPICSVAFLNGKAQTGIGTSSPVNKFQVETSAAAPSTSGTSANGNLRLGATGANQVLDFGLGTTYGWLQARDKSSYATNYILSLNPNGGNVGINKTNPSKPLDVNGDVAVSGSVTGGNASSSTISGFSANVATISSAYSLSAADNGKIIQSTSASAITITIPTGLPTGFNCTVVQFGTGQITFSGTYFNRGGFTKTVSQYAMVSIVHLGSNNIIVSGEMSN